MMKMPDNTWKSVMDYFHLKLDHLYPSQEVDSFFWWLIEYHVGKSRLDFMKDPDIRMSESQLLDFIRFSRRLAKNEPIQYITGHTDFMGLDLLVNSSVLIPRPETEELVSWINETNFTSKNFEVVDVCSGSGCIGLTLKKLQPSWSVSGMDIDFSALEMANENARRLKLDVHFSKQDALNLKDTSKKYDLIVSNPPYIKELERTDMKANVLEYEPDLALFVPNDDPLRFYRAIAKWAKLVLNPHGQLFFEINEAHGNEMITMLKELGFNEVELRNDIFDKPRMIKAIS